jgi:hypothetical protein
LEFGCFAFATFVYDTKQKGNAASSVFPAEQWPGRKDADSQRSGDARASPNEQTHVRVTLAGVYYGKAVDRFPPSSRLN